MGLHPAPTPSGVEWTLRQGEQDDSVLDVPANTAEPCHIHDALKDCQPYRDAFSARMNRAYKTIAGDPGSGSLLAASIQARFQAAMSRFDTVIHSESARWGDMYPKKTGGPYTKSDPAYRPNDPNKGDWSRSTAYILKHWFPERDPLFRSALQTAGLYTPTP